MVCLDVDDKARIDSERNQGRAPDMDWLDHDRLGFNYRLSDIACALGLAQLERLDDLLAGRARVADAYREALSGIDGLDLPCPDTGGHRRGWCEAPTTARATATSARGRARASAGSWGSGAPLPARTGRGGAELCMRC